MSLDRFDGSGHQEMEAPDGTVALEDDTRDTARPAAKRPRLSQPAHPANVDTLHGLGDGIDHVQEAEASLLQLEVRTHLPSLDRALVGAHVAAEERALLLQVRELLSEVAVDYSGEHAALQIAQRVGSLLRSLPEAEVSHDAVRGYLRDLSVSLAVSLFETRARALHTVPLARLYFSLVARSSHG